jgi:hypothetical protein
VLRKDKTEESAVGRGPECGHVPLLRARCVIPRALVGPEEYAEMQELWLRSASEMRMAGFPAGMLDFEDFFE